MRLTYATVGYLRVTCGWAHFGGSCPRRPSFTRRAGRDAPRRPCGERDALPLSVGSLKMTWSYPQISYWARTQSYSPRQTA